MRMPGGLILPLPSALCHRLIRSWRLAADEALQTLQLPVYPGPGPRQLSKLFPNLRVLKLQPAVPIDSSSAACCTGCGHIVSCSQAACSAKPGAHGGAVCSQTLDGRDNRCSGITAACGCATPAVGSSSSGSSAAAGACAQQRCAIALVGELISDLNGLPGLASLSLELRRNMVPVGSQPSAAARAAAEVAARQLATPPMTPQAAGQHCHTQLVCGQQGDMVVPYEASAAAAAAQASARRPADEVVVELLVGRMEALRGLTQLTLIGRPTTSCCRLPLGVSSCSNLVSLCLK